MRNIAIVFACASLFASGRRVHTSSGKYQSNAVTESQKASKSSDAWSNRRELADSKPELAKALNAILLARNPAAAFKLPGAGMNLPAGHRAALGHSRQRMPVMSSKEDVDQQVSGQEGKEKQAAKQLAAAAMSAAILTQAATPAHAIFGLVYDPAVADVVYKGHYTGLAFVFLSLLAQQNKFEERMSPDDFNTAALANKVFYAGLALSLVTGFLLVTQYGKGWYFYSREPTFWLKMELLAAVIGISIYPTTKISQRETELGENAEQTMKRMSGPLILGIKEKYNNMFIPMVFTPIMALIMARGIGYFDWWPWPVGALPPVLTLAGVGYSSYQEAMAWDDAEYRKAEEYRREIERAERVARMEASITEGEVVETEPEKEEAAAQGADDAPISLGVKLNLPKKKGTAKFDDV